MNESHLSGSINDENSLTCNAHLASNGSDIDEIERNGLIETTKNWVGKLIFFKVH